jgi:hypothetical protein
MTALTLTQTGHRPLTANEHRRLTPFVRAKRDKDYRTWWSVAARVEKWPHVDAADITITPLHKDGRSPQDASSCHPAAKAAIDGLVDAGVLTDDGPAFVRSVTFLAPDICGVDGMRLTLTPHVRTAA